jgi:hypothetical protein
MGVKLNAGFEICALDMAIGWSRQRVFSKRPHQVSSDLGAH